MIYLTKLPFLCGHDGNHIIFCCWCIRLLQEIIKHKNKYALLIYDIVV
jgi:hypothetical protein